MQGHVLLMVEFAKGVLGEREEGRRNFLYTVGYLSHFGVLSDEPLLVVKLFFGLFELRIATRLELHQLKLQIFVFVPHRCESFSLAETHTAVERLARKGTAHSLKNGLIRRAILLFEAMYVVL